MTGDKDRWRCCVADTERVLGLAVGAMFVRETFHEDDKQLVRYYSEVYAD